MYQLSQLGFDPFFQQQVTQAHAHFLPARIAAQHRGQYDVWYDGGQGTAALTGRMAKQLQPEQFPTVGDWVLLKEMPTAEPALIECILERRTAFSRGAAGRQSREQVVAANIDVVFAVCGLDNDYNPARIERYLARIWAGGAQPVVILNKIDICDRTAQRVAEIESLCMGVPVYAVSATRQEGLAVLNNHVGPGITTAFMGSSGAGKSTLINALLGEERMRTAEIRATDGRGRHTTTHRQLLFVPQGGLLIDTPGMRELQLLDEEGLDTLFADIEELALGCRFRDCRHEGEPGCGVRAAVEAGALPAERLEHYHKLEKEAKANELRHNTHLQRKSEKVWGTLYDEVKRLKQWKRGE